MGKKRLDCSYPNLVRIRELRNLIARKYIKDKLHKLHLAALEFALLLIDLDAKGYTLLDEYCLEGTVA